MVLRASALNLLIVGLMMVVFTFLWRALAAKLAAGDSEIGDAVGGAMAVIL